MKITAHILARDEAEIFLYAARHYTSFCGHVVLHDMGSTDGTLEIAAQFGIEVRKWDSGDKVDDRVNKLIKETCWQGTDADWVICADADELIYFPDGHKEAFESYTAQNIPIVKPHGWEMTSEAMPTTAGQIYDEIKMGGRDDQWYAKPIIFTPKMVGCIEFGAGAHVCRGTNKDGTLMFENPTVFSKPPAYLLHYHQIGSIERIAKKYDRTRSRMCDANVNNKWGNFEPGIKHAQDKRNFILSRLERVITA
jgi:glycosyltransferase involved in cell wall biosynthesis